MIAGIETGGTKIVCGVAPSDQQDRPTMVRRFPTTSPDETFERINAFLDEAARSEPIEALGVASFGPVDSDRGSARFGWITSTPKAGWQQTDVLGAIRLASSVPTAFLHDVGAAALGEHRWGAGTGFANVAYATVGTGIGVGLVVEGRVLSGAGWPELGHLLVRRHPDDDFEGVCPFHGDCIEGLAAGPAVLARWGVDASTLADQHRDAELDVLASYIAQLVYTTALTVGIDRMVLGGGVMLTPGLLHRIRVETGRIAAGYGPAPLADGLDTLVSAPALGGSSGVVGAITAASDLLRNVHLHSPT